MRTRVKYCGLVRPQDVDAAVAIGADAVGLVFYRNSPRLLDTESASALRRRLPSWVRAVGLFVNEPVDSIELIARRVGLDVVQLHGDETPSLAGGLSRPWWKALRVGRAADGTAISPPSILQSMQAFEAAEFFLLDSFSTGYGGSGRTFDWSLVPQGAGRRLIMSGGLDPGNVGAAIGSIRPFAVDTSSGIQAENPREKDVGRMEQFMEAVRQADGTPAPGQQ